MSRVTIQAVADQAGVSVSTASRALNRVNTRLPISPSTRQRVDDAARRLGYVPSGAARAMRTGRTRTLGVFGTSSNFFAQVRAAFAAQIMAGLFAAAGRRGYHVTLLTGFEQDDDPSGIMADLGMTDGLLVINRDIQADPRLANALGRWPRPVVYALDHPEAAGVYATAPDDRQGGRLAADALLAAGHRRIAFVSRPYFAGIFDRRRGGYADALADAGLDVDPRLDLIADDRLAQRLAESGATAAVCANEGIADQTAGVAAEHGIGLDVIAFSFDGAANPKGLAQVTHPLAEVIGSAADVLIDLIEGKQPRRKRRIFPYRYEPAPGP